VCHTPPKGITCHVIKIPLPPSVITAVQFLTATGRYSEGCWGSEAVRQSSLCSYFNIFLLVIVCVGPVVKTVTVHSSCNGMSLRIGDLQCPGTS